MLNRSFCQLKSAHPVSPTRFFTLETFLALYKLCVSFLFYFCLRYTSCFGGFAHVLLYYFGRFSFPRVEKFHSTAVIGACPVTTDCIVNMSQCENNNNNYNYMCSKTETTINYG